MKFFKYKAQRSEGIFQIELSCQEMKKKQTIKDRWKSQEMNWK